MYIDFNPHSDLGAHVNPANSIQACHARKTLWIADPSPEELNLLRTTVNLPGVLQAWVHTGDEMRQEPCQFRLVVEINNDQRRSVELAADIRSKGQLAGFSLNVWCIPAGQVNQFPWLLDDAVRLI